MAEDDAQLHRDFRGRVGALLEALPASKRRAVVWLHARGHARTRDTVSDPSCVPAPPGGWREGAFFPAAPPPAARSRAAASSGCAATSSVTSTWSGGARGSGFAAVTICGTSTPTNDASASDAASRETSGPKTYTYVR